MRETMIITIPVNSARCGHFLDYNHMITVDLAACSHFLDYNLVIRMVSVGMWSLFGLQSRDSDGFGGNVVTFWTTFSRSRLIRRDMVTFWTTFNDLKGNRMNDINFTWEDALNFEGETGPYVQYTHARTCSVIRRAQIEKGIDITTDYSKINTTLLQNTEAFAVIKTLQSFGERIELAMTKLEPSIITRYLLDLARDFNRFYHAYHVLVDDRELCKSRLAVVACVRITLHNGLKLIGLEAPEEI